MDVDHDRLSVPGDQVGTVRHTSRDGLVGNRYELWEALSLITGGGLVGLDDGGEVGPRVTKHAVHAVLF